MHQFSPLLLSQQKGSYSHLVSIYIFLSRFQAICHPLSLNSRTGVGRARRVVLLVWTSSILSALPWAVYAKVNYIKFDGHDLLESAWCGMPFHEENLNTAPLYLIIASTLMYFIIPFSIVFVLYLRYIVSLCHQSKLLSGSGLL